MANDDETGAATGTLSFTSALSVVLCTEALLFVLLFAILWSSLRKLTVRAAIHSSDRGGDSKSALFLFLFLRVSASGQRGLQLPCLQRSAARGA